MIAAEMPPHRFTVYIGFTRGKPRLIEKESLETFANIFSDTPGFRVIRVDDDTFPRDVTATLLAGEKV